MPFLRLPLWCSNGKQTKMKSSSILSMGYYSWKSIHTFNSSFSVLSTCCRFNFTSIKLNVYFLSTSHKYLITKTRRFLKNNIMHGDNFKWLSCTDNISTMFNVLERLWLHRPIPCSHVSKNLFFMPFLPESHLTTQ